MRNADSKFRNAVTACTDLTIQEGLHALPSTDRGKIQSKDTRSITGSVNMDDCLKQSHPNDTRWDYAVGYKGSNGQEKAYFIEVHPAETREISIVVRKAQFLKAWTAKNAPDLWAMPREIHWVASGRCNIRLNDAYRRNLSMVGVHPPKENLVLV